MTTSGPWSTPHTPAPWISHDVTDDGDPDCGSWVVDLPDQASDLTVSRLYFGDMETNTGTDIANARLIAAAPDLLAALTSVLDVVESGDPLPLAAIEAAVARATGESGR